MDLPGSHHKTFHSHAETMYSKLEELQDHVFSQTVAYVREVHAKHSGITLTEDDVLDISVSLEGTWSTCGRSSHAGAGCMVDLLTRTLCSCSCHVHLLPGLRNDRPEVTTGQARGIHTS